MAENKSKKKRIARIGNMASAGTTSSFHYNDELEPVDCNLVNDIIESMNKSQSPMSYQQFQESQSKRKVISRTTKKRSSSKQISNSLSSKKMKFVPEKTFPLMAKCQKSMKYLKKNMCIPKPRAHVGSFPRSLQMLTSSYSYKDCSIKTKQNFRKSSSPEMNAMQDKAKLCHSLSNSCDKNEAVSFEGEPKCMSDSDSDYEFENFIQKHQLEASYNYPADSSIANRKIEKSKKTKRKVRKRLLSCTKKYSKITSKKLSDLEESAESEVESNGNNHNDINLDEISFSRQSPPRRFQRIVEYNSDDSASNTHVNDFGTSIYDSSSSSEHEYMVIHSSKENVNSVVGLDNSERFDILPSDPVTLSSTSLSEFNNTPECDALKLKCKTPCFVALTRDRLLDKKVILQTKNSSVTNMVSTSNLYDDDDDCIIISETLTSQGSESIKQAIANRISSEEKSIDISKPPNLQALDLTQNKYTLNEKLTITSNNLGPQTGTTSMVSSQKPSSILCGDKTMPFKVQGGDKEISSSVAILSDIEKDECLTVSKTTSNTNKNANSDECEKKIASTAIRIPHDMSDLSKNETGICLHSASATSSTEKKSPIKILSVRSLTKSEFITLSGEESDSENVPTATNESATNKDSDIEMIFSNQKLEVVLKKNPESCLTQSIDSDSDDCIILNDADLPNKKDAAKNIDEVQQGSQVKSVDTDNNDKMNSNKSEKTIISNELNSGNSMIVEILKTIDFNYIKKVLKETSTDSQEVEKSDGISCKAENSLCDVVQNSEIAADSSPEKLKQSQNDTCSSQKQTSINLNIAHGCSEINIKINDSKTSAVDTHEGATKLVENSVLHEVMKKDHENVPCPNKFLQIHSSRNCDKTSFCSNTSLAVPNLSEKQIVASRHARKKRRSHPVVSKVESFESTSEELDVIASEFIQNLDMKHENVLPLLELYKTEYKRFKEIKCTEQNVAAGLKLLEDTQAKKLIFISSSIKNILKNDPCFHKINNEFRNNTQEDKSFIKCCPVKKRETLDEIEKPVDCVTQPSNSNCTDIEKNDKVSIFHPSIIERTSEVLNSKSLGPSSNQEVYNHLISTVCAECGKRATCACSDCAKVFYCSTECAVSFWDKGHSTTCRK